jgi:hypothetical protein
VKKSTSLLASLVVAFMACFAEGGAEVSGRVTDATGKPLEGVEVDIEAPIGSAYALDHKTVASSRSKNNGCFDAGGLHVSGSIPLTIRASKDGFKPYAGHFVSGFYTNDIRLEATNSVATSAGQFTPHDVRRSGRAPCQQ